MTNFFSRNFRAELDRLSTEIQFGKKSQGYAFIHILQNMKMLKELVISKEYIKENLIPM